MPVIFQRFWEWWTMPMMMPPGDAGGHAVDLPAPVSVPPVTVIPVPMARAPVLRSMASAPIVVDDVDQAILIAFYECGLNIDFCRPDFDLARTGKLNDVLVHASAALAQSHPLRTVADVKALLSHA